MKKYYFFLLTLFMAAFSASASVTVCDQGPDENGHFNTPYIKSGTVTWDESSKTLTLNNAVIDHSSESPYDYVYPIRVTEDATIIIRGECKLTTTGFVALAFEGTNSKTVTIQGDGNLYVDSRLRGIFLVCTRLTIKDITLQAAKGIMNNGDGVLCALMFDNVKADINGVVERIGEPISFQNCTITYPVDAYVVEAEGYGYYIAQGDGSPATHIVISRNGSGITGDVNGDGEVNIADVTAVIDVILGGGNNPRADVNNDGEINIADVNLLIDIILCGPEPDTPDMESFTVNGVTFKMVNVKSGTFTMGATPEVIDKANANEYPAHEVTLTNNYYMGETEVTQALWQAVMGANPSQYSTDPNRPVENVSWNDCHEFITMLNQMTGKNFRLPTEAEWEYAARGGNKSQHYRYAGSNDVNEVCWYYYTDATAEYGTKVVATLKPNELGLYDMSGNVLEWCEDYYSSSYYSISPSNNPTGPTSGMYRVIRGGCWDFTYPEDCRVSYRNGINEGGVKSDVGLRLAM